MLLRDYQQRAIADLYRWFEAGNAGHPCLVLPTGSGKSHIIAALCKDALLHWPETRILMLTHVKELIVQNAEKLRQHWPGAPMGIYSASVGKRHLGEPITFAGIQSVRTRGALLGHIDLVIIDEAHLVSHKDEGSYRALLKELESINPALRVIGLTATPYRLGHGLITDKPAVFDDLIEPVGIEELINNGYLAPLRSKITAAKLDTEGVHKRGGEYIESELQAAVDTADQNAAVVREVIRLAGDRRSWLCFCAGVQHAEHIAEALRQNGVTAECVTGETPKAERDRMLKEFKAGRIRAMTNANVLTTGFDHPGIDLIAMLRPTMSPGLYVQMAGRGMRPAPGKTDCLVLDFAGVVAQHGPITAVQPPKKKGELAGEAPVRTCEQCGEIVHISVKACPACGTPFPEAEKPPVVLHQDDIMGLEGTEMTVSDWRWRVHTSRASGKLMLAVTYYGGLSDKPVTEYLPVLHDGYAGDKAIRQLMGMVRDSRAEVSPGERIDGEEGLAVIAWRMNRSRHPAMIEYRADGKFFRVLMRIWIWDHLTHNT